jgi:hypothetical protein
LIDTYRRAIGSFRRILGLPNPAPPTSAPPPASPRTRSAPHLS